MWLLHLASSRILQVHLFTPTFVLVLRAKAMTEQKTCWESFKVDGTAIVEKIKDLIRAGNVRRVVVEHDGRTIAEFPVTVGVVGVVLAPIAAALGTLVALLQNCTIHVERVQPESGEASSDRSVRHQG
jgi:hypothetical protein